MSYFVYTHRDVEAAVEITIEETMRAVVLQILALHPSIASRNGPFVHRPFADPFPWRTGRDEALGAVTRINQPALRARINARWSERS